MLHIQSQKNTYDNNTIPHCPQNFSFLLQYMFFRYYLLQHINAKIKVSHLASK